MKSKVSVSRLLDTNVSIKSPGRNVVTEKKEPVLWFQNILWYRAEPAFLWLHHVVFKCLSNLQYNTTEKDLDMKYEGWKSFQVEGVTDANMHYKH